MLNKAPPLSSQSPSSIWPVVDILSSNSWLLHHAKGWVFLFVFSAVSMHMLLYALTKSMSHWALCEASGKEREKEELTDDGVHRLMSIHDQMCFIS